MASILGSQGVAALATAMAVSGTVILLAIRLQKSLPLSLDDQIPQPSQQTLRSCISTEGKKQKNKNKKKKRVHFAEDVMDPRGNGEEFRRQLMMKMKNTNNNSSATTAFKASPKLKKMPANRVALYNGILRDRVVQRLAYSY